MQSKLQYIIQELNKTPIEGVYKAKKCIAELTAKYTEQSEFVETITEAKLKAHAFISDVLTLSERKERKSYTAKVTKIVKGLERHTYAPEMNALHFNSGRVFVVPQATTVEEGVERMLNTVSISRIRGILLEG